MNAAEPLPLYQQIAESLRSSIAANHLGDRLPTENQLAQAFHVSVPTIKKALSVLVADELITRIPGKGTFVKSMHTTLAGSSTKVNVPDRETSDRPTIIGVILAGMQDTFSTRLLNGISDGLASHNAHALLGISSDQQESESETIDRFLRAGVDGLIIFPVEGELYNADIVGLSLQRFPLVLVDRWMPGIDVSRVVGEHAKGAADAVNYLLNLGHRRIGLVSVASDYPLSTQSIIERKEGFIRAFRERNLPWDERWLWMVGRDDIKDEGEAVSFLIEQLENAPSVTALIGVSASDTRLIVQAAREFGLGIPNDLSVMGFDAGSRVGGFNSMDFEGGDVAPVAWLDQSEYTIGAEAAKLVCRLIARPSTNEVIEVPVVLRPGKTCSSPAEFNVLCR